MICLPVNFILLGLIGTQEIMVLIIFVLPLILLYIGVRNIVKWYSQKRTSPITGTAAEIEKLFTLKEKEVITQEEFDDQKSRLLQ